MEVPQELPVDRGVRHEIDLEPGSKYCVTRQWPLPKEQVEAIDAFFAKRAAAGQVRESKSPHCSPTFCVRKATGGWRIVHAFNKLNDATIPAQTPIPRKDVLIDGMQGSTVFSTMDLMDGFYQILMREQDIPLTAVSTPSGMLWEWLVMPQGLKNAPATFNRLVQSVMREHRAYAPSYFDDIYVHSKPEGKHSALEMHQTHLRLVLATMRKHKLYANLKKCIFAADEIPVLGCFVGKNGVRVDPEKVEAIAKWPAPTDVKSMRKWLGLANYLHKYAANYAEMAKPLTDLLRKDVPWEWNAQHQAAFEKIKQSLISAPILALPDDTKPFSVVCDASDYAIGCALMQKDAEGRDRVISYQSRQLKAAELNYRVHDKELLAIKYALMKFRVHLLGAQPFVVYTDHASLRTATKSPHLSQRMARWLSFFAEYNFSVEYKPGKNNVLADALSRRQDMEDLHVASRPMLEAALQTARVHVTDAQVELNRVHVSTVNAPLREEIQRKYANDEQCSELIAFLAGRSTELSAHNRAKLPRFSYADGLLWYNLSEADYPRVVVPNDTDLREQILSEHHDTPMAGHLGREKTFLSIAAHFWWPHLYKWVTNFLRSCEVCQRVKAAAATQAPLHPLPIPTDCWKSISMDFVFGYPADAHSNTGAMVVVDRLSKMLHIIAVRETVTGKQCAALFVDNIFRLHGMPTSIVSDRDPRFTSAFWRELFRLLGTSLNMSTTDHPQSDGQTERAIRVVEDVLRAHCMAHPQTWSAHLALVEFALNNAVHSSHGHTPFYVNGLRHPLVPTALGGDHTLIGGRSTSARSAHARDVAPEGASSTVAQCNSTVLGDPLPNGNRSTGDAQLQGNTASEHAPLARGAPLTMPEGIESLAHEKPNSDGDNPVESDATPGDPDSDPVVTANVLLLGKPSQKELKIANDFVAIRARVLAQVRENVAVAQARQKQQADKKGRNNKFNFVIGDKVLLSTKNLPRAALPNTKSTKLMPRWIGPFEVLQRVGDLDYRLDIPSRMKLHPTFYVGLLKPYVDPEAISLSGKDNRSRSEMDSAAETPLEEHPTDEESVREAAPQAGHAANPAWTCLSPRDSPDRPSVGQHSPPGSCRNTATRGAGRSRPGAPCQTTALASAGSRSENAARPSRAPNAQCGDAVSRASDDLPRAAGELPRAARARRPSVHAHPRGKSISRARSSAPGAAAGQPHRVPQGARGPQHEPLRARDGAGLRDPKLSSVRKQRTGTSDDSTHHTRRRTGNPRRGSQRAPPAVLDSEGEPRFRVERLLRHRGRAPYRHFLVKWKGYPVQESTWEMEQVLHEDFPELLHAFDNALQ